MNLTDYTALELGRLIRDKKVSISEGLDAVFSKIDTKEKDLHCYLTIDREGAYAQATRLQELLMKGEADGPLFGVPVAVKDNLCTRGLRTTCASKMLENFIPPYDATAVEYLKKAGMILIGKTNLDEFAMGNTTENSWFGETKNPINPLHVPGGSSGGSAAVVRAGECFAALGTDTGGSVRQPASHCGVVGIKPTYGTVSRYGLVAYGSSMDQVGVLTKDVADGAALLDAIAYYDPKDATCVGREKGWEKALGKGVKGLRIGIPKDYFEMELDPEVGDAVMEAARCLEREGAILEEFELGLAEYAVPAYYTIVCGEASSNLERYDGMKYGFLAKEADLQRTYGSTRSQGFGREVRRRIMLGTFVLSEGYYEAYYLKALKVRRLIKEAFDRAFQKYDVLLGPVAPKTAPRLGAKEQDPLFGYLADKYTVPANLCGLPAMSLPCGTDQNGLPIGLQLIGRQFGERRMIQAADAFESVRGIREGGLYE
ncbi:MAG: Asp-tRNA(Asn)/Glu-tRNA(Gln) amidotransferase subunit GatA [Lachnospiraceae bacterium]|nr:Asp-tRNA(Asn)/Glu-tRNA(Gln) amidotransferase subunit GatA [Lachnospiraceae bacterium]